jgi:hypothetical protein
MITSAMIRPRFDIIVIDLESTALLLVEYYNILRLLNDIRANSKIHQKKNVPGRMKQRW